MPKGLKDLQMLRLIKAFQKVTDEHARRAILRYVEDQAQNGRTETQSNDGTPENAGLRRQQILASARRSRSEATIGPRGQRAWSPISPQLACFRNVAPRQALRRMARYYFDTRDNEKFIADDIGVEISSLDHVKTTASAAMADFAKDVLPGSVLRRLAIEVRDDFGPILTVLLTFEVAQVRPLN